ncbi:hypothetical protein B9128_18435 [Shigella sonnei]|uniref:Nitrite extrusion protein 2 n=1 Tax=Shigella sonnei TaxID=624 RepID=A0AAU8W898_SHISO|nr:hypothetical protein B9127_02620 [Shigella sonnei]ARS07895.1 hypothetical protein BZ172_23305 [Shigella sonnei]ASN33476.1 hypothetical protein B9129_01990 [Shigella sonnei]ASN44090.1 hypothetical protein B9128_18435 [Shigella sonnei]AWX18103.1 hypothetical protein CH310_11240 [Shigella sonnei]
MVRRLRFSGPKTSIICTPMTSLKTSIKTITYLSDTGCLEIQGASLRTFSACGPGKCTGAFHSHEARQSAQIQ